MREARDPFENKHSFRPTHTQGRLPEPVKICAQEVRSTSLWLADRGPWGPELGLRFGMDRRALEWKQGAEYCEHQDARHRQQALLRFVALFA